MPAIKNKPIEKVVKKPKTSTKKYSKTKLIPRSRKVAQRPKNIAIQMDDIATINVARDSTYLLSLEAQKRGHILYYYQPNQLFLKNGIVMAYVTKLKLSADEKNHYSLGATTLVNMEKMDVILMRQDPPFDMNYITYTHLLERISDKVLVINNPKSVRDCPEKIFATMFADLMPPTVITNEIAIAQDFLKEQKHLILKPLYAFGGTDIYDAKNIKQLNDKFKYLQDKYNAPLMLQKYLKNISKGDKRIILINGEFAGALNRIPKKNQFISNMAQGGTAIKTKLTKREKEICARLKPELQKRDLLLVGIDVIDGYLTEINSTSPTGLKVINGLYNIHLEKQFWDVIEKMC